MPQADEVYTAIVAVPAVIIIWESFKLGYRAQVERNSTWITFKTLAGAKEAFRRVEQFYGDSGKHAEAVLTWMRTDPRIEVRVPNAMITGLDFKTAVDRFRYEVEKAETAND